MVNYDKFFANFVHYDRLHNYEKYFYVKQKYDIYDKTDTEYLNALPDVHGLREDAYVVTDLDFGTYDSYAQLVVYEDTIVGELPKNYSLDNISSVATDIDLSAYGFRKVGISRWIKKERMRSL